MAVHQFHHQIIRANIVEDADIRVIQGRDGVRFPFEASAETHGSDLDGNCAIEAQVSGFIDGAHAAGSERRQDLVRSKLRAGLEGAFTGRLPRWIVKHSVGGLSQQRFHFATELFVAARGFL
jgi:hypothetical protein